MTREADQRSKSVDLLADAFDRIRALVHDTLEDLRPDELSLAPDSGANTIAWLVWHLTRVQDHYVAELTESEQVWVAQAWVDRFGLPFEPAATGYGQDADEVAAVKVASSRLLADYHDAVHARTAQFVVTLADADLDRIVDRAWDPPVSLGARLVSVIADDLQHVGQAAFVRGMVVRRRVAGRRVEDRVT